jgi:predicted DNA-binding protein (MmcQ/YjbR family)
MLDSRTNMAREKQGRMIRESYQLAVSGLLAVQRQNIKLVR